MPVFDPSCIDVEDFLDCLDIRNVSRATANEYRFSCPYPAHDDGDENPSCYMNIETTAFFCQSCHARGNAVSFAADVLRVSPIESTRLLKQRYARGGIDPDSRSMVEEIRKILNRQPPEKRENLILDESVLDAYRRNWDYTDAKTVWGQYIFRRFSRRELIRWQFGYSAEFDRITLPIRDEEGRLVGIKARAWDDRKPKYLNLHDRSNGVKPFLKNEIVFGLDRVRKWPGYDGRMIVVEGEYNTIAMHSLGYMNTVAINGSYFGERQIKLIKRFADSVTLLFDSDRAGRDATEAVAAALRDFLPIYICPDHEGDPADMHPYSVRRCVRAAKSLAEIALVGS